MKELTLVPIGGLGNRLHALISAISFAQKYQLRLRVYWFKDWGMGAAFEDLFTLNKDYTPFVEIVEAKGLDYLYDRPRKRNLWLPAVFQKAYFDFHVNEGEVADEFSIEDLIEWTEKGDRAYLVQYRTFYPSANLQSYLSLQPRLSDRVSKVLEDLGEDRRIGLHIRRTDNVNSIDESPLEAFYACLDQEIEGSESVSCYLATDDEATKRLFIQRYGKRVTVNGKPAVRDSLQGIEDAIVEMFVLSQMDCIYGSFYSSFSELASEIGQVPLKIVRKEMQ